MNLDPEVTVTHSATLCSGDKAWVCLQNARCLLSWEVGPGSGFHLWPWPEQPWEKNLKGALMYRKTNERHFLQSDWWEDQHTRCLRNSIHPPGRRTHGIFPYTKSPRPHFQGQSRQGCCLGYSKGGDHQSPAMLNLLQKASPLWLDKDFRSGRVYSVSQGLRMWLSGGVGT